MVAKDSLQQSMDKAVKRYPSLFRLPSTHKVLLLLPLFCVGGGFLSTVILFQSIHGVLDGVIFGASLFLISLIVDYVSIRSILRKNTILDFRRAIALSLFCWGLWFVFVSIGVGLGAIFGTQWWVRLCLLGFSAVMIFRLIVFGSVTSLSWVRLVTVSLLEPFSCVVPFMILWAENGYSFSHLMPWFFLFSPAVAIGSAYAFLYMLDNVGKKMLGLRSLSLFRAFMLNWVMGLNAPFEELLEKLGEERNVEISLMKFGSSKPKAIIVVPSVHPGPFKNIGSSPLPSLLKTELEKRLGCIVCVPHGLLGHEFDVASQSQNQRIINSVATVAEQMVVSDKMGSSFVKVSNGLATACCQIFGRSVFVSFTLAPRTIEDLPQELGSFVHKEAEKHGLRLGAVVNAHNCIDGKVEMQRALVSLKDVAVKCLDKAASLTRSVFEVGIATISPLDLSPEKGMGPGGITVVVVKSGGQKTAYVVVDGNNMISGLRERILASLVSVGIDDGEILTTDTHSVCALVLNGLGYHPVGEVMDNTRLIDYIKKTAQKAMANIEKVEVASHNITVPNVKVIGAERLENLCLLVEKGVQRAKTALIPVLALSGLLLLNFLWFI